MGILYPGNGTLNLICSNLNQNRTICQSHYFINHIFHTDNQISDYSFLAHLTNTTTNEMCKLKNKVIKKNNSKTYTLWNNGIDSESITQVAEKLWVSRMSNSANCILHSQSVTPTGINCIQRVNNSLKKKNKFLNKYKSCVLIIIYKTNRLTSQ